MYNILVKYPTRQRADLFLKTLSDYVFKAKDNGKIFYLVSYDSDDASMTQEVISRAQSFHEHVLFFSGTSESKIHACNRDIDRFPNPWDIVLLVSDDMHVQVNGWDECIRNDFQHHFPDTDGCLWYHDGSNQKRVNTLSCMGKKYYHRFHYLYHPSYRSFFCDNEHTEVAMGLQKMRFIDHVIARHEHPNWGGGVKRDPLYDLNDQHWKYDQNIYNQRKALGFPV